MPLIGATHSAQHKDEAPYFSSLAELDSWMDTPHERLGGVKPYVPRSTSVRGVNTANRGSLLVCHDYKGGYTESPSALSYTFNFWSLCNIFIYFAHHRITIPPSGWTNAAHRHGVKMLGTLIFEGSGEQDCLRLLVGKLPGSKTGPASPSPNPNALPLSPHYARLLARLAAQRGFDGYLLNVEVPLRGGAEQSRVLSAWISLLRSELLSSVGTHAEVIWYDSVVVTGQLRWQDRLNSLNLPFLLPSTGLFTNYTWPPSYPDLTASFFLNLESALHASSLSLRSLYTGIDVWGRGQHGNGGLGCYKSLAHIAPQTLGLSVALFGHAWTWESEQDKPGWDWPAWWRYERLFWLGPEDANEEVKVPDEPPPRQGESPCEHGPFQPIADFFVHQPPPNPSQLAFHMSFGVGVGQRWFVEGKKVLEREAWTDVDKQGLLGDMLWPRPKPACDGDAREEALPKVSASLNFEDAWMGGNSLRLSLSGEGSTAEDAIFRCVWVPVQSLAITPWTSYRAILVYKVEPQLPSDQPRAEVDLDLGLSLKPLVEGLSEITLSPVAREQAYNLPGGWTRIAVDFALPDDDPTEACAAVGLVIGFAADDPTLPYSFSLLLGQIAVYPLPSAAESQPQPKVLWAHYAPSPTHGVLTWETAMTLPALSSITLSGPEDVRPAWIAPRVSELPAFLYFNVYAQAHGADGHVAGPESALFIGTTGWDGRRNRFFVDRECLPDGLRTAMAKGVRFYVQGVTDRGKVLDWGDCAFVDSP